MFKTKTNSFWRIISVVVVLGLALSPIAAQRTSATDTLSNPMALGTSIEGATVTFVAGGNSTAYTGASVAPIVQSINVGGSDIDIDDTNFVITYKRDGQATTDLTNPGKIDITITGQNTYEDSVETSFTIVRDVKIDFSFDRQNANDEVAYEYNGAFITDTANNGISGDFGMMITYYNRTLDQFTDGFAKPGDYVLTINLTNPGYRVIGNNSVSLYVRPVLLSNSDGSIKVKNAKGFAKGITLGEASLTDNIYTINARTDITSQMNGAKVMMNIALLKDGQPYTTTDEIEVIAKIGKLQLDGAKLYTNNGNTTKFEEIEYSQDDDTITIQSNKLGTFVIAQPTSFEVLPTVLLCITIVALFAAGIISLGLLCTSKNK